SPRVLSLRACAETQAAIERAKHAAEIGAAFQDQARRRDHAVSALPPRQLRRLLDAVERGFRGAPEHREHGFLSERVDGVVAPLAARDFAPIDVEDLAKLSAVTRHAAASRQGLGKTCVDALLK